jgi:excisionase family DNA binding protein
MATTSAPRVVTYEEAADLLRISRSSLQRLIRAGHVRIVLIGGARRVLLSSVDAYLRRQAGG